MGALKSDSLFFLLCITAFLFLGNTVFFYKFLKTLLSHKVVAIAYSWLTLFTYACL